MSKNSPPRVRLILAFVCCTAFAAAVRAGGPAVWVISTRAELLRGDARGVSVTDGGALTLAPELKEVFDTGQAYVWSSAVDGAGNVYLGTGQEGRIFRVGADGRGAPLYDAPESNVTAFITTLVFQTYGAG